MQEKKRLSRRTKYLVAVIVATLVLALAIFVHSIQRVDPRALDTLIEQELPPGSDQAQVIAFLVSNRISHSEYVRKDHRIQAQIGKSRVGFIRARILIDFYFDDRDKLVRHKIGRAHV